MGLAMGHDYENDRNMQATDFYHNSILLAGIALREALLGHDMVALD